MAKPSNRAAKEVKEQAKREHQHQLDLAVAFILNGDDDATIYSATNAHRARWPLVSRSTLSRALVAAKSGAVHELGVRASSRVFMPEEERTLVRYVHMKADAQQAINRDALEKVGVDLLRHRQGLLSKGGRTAVPPLSPNATRVLNGGGLGQDWSGRARAASARARRPSCRAVAPSAPAAANSITLVTAARFLGLAPSLVLPRGLAIGIDLCSEQAVMCRVRTCLLE